MKVRIIRNRYNTNSDNNDKNNEIKLRSSSRNKSVKAGLDSTFHMTSNLMPAVVNRCTLRCGSCFTRARRNRTDTRHGLAWTEMDQTTHTHVYTPVTQLSALLSNLKGTHRDWFTRSEPTVKAPRQRRQPSVPLSTVF